MNFFLKQKYNAFIIDDSELDISILSKSLKEFKEIELVGVATCAEKGEIIIMDLHPDLLFLDIGLPQKDGLVLLRSIQNKVTWSMQIVMYSSYTKYVLESFREFAFDYLIKPLDKKTLAEIMQRFFTFKKNERRNVDPFLEIVDTNLKETKFRIITPTGTKIIQLNQIVYFEYNKDRKLWTVIINNNKRHNLQYKTNANTIISYSHFFKQINKFQIININYLAEYTDDSCILSFPRGNNNVFKVSRNALKTLHKEYIQL